MKPRAPFVFVILLLTAGLLAGCGLLGSQESTSVASVTLTDKIDERTKKPLSDLTEFPAGTKVIYVAALVKNPRKGTKLEAQWSYDGESKGTFTTVDTAEVTFVADSRDKYVAYSLTATTTFPAGAYKVQVSLNGTNVKELTFAVK